MYNAWSYLVESSGEGVMEHVILFQYSFKQNMELKYKEFYGFSRFLLDSLQYRKE